jgi:hypothetical protein
MERSKMNLLLATAILAASAVAALGADATGKWRGIATDKGPPLTFNLQHRGSSLTGTVESARGVPPIAQIKNGRVNADNIAFDVEREVQGNTVMFKYSGKIEGDTLNLTVEAPDGPHKFTLKKQ